MRYLFLFFSLLVFTSKAQPLTNALEQAYAVMLSDEQLKHASISFTLIDSKSKQILFEKNKNVPLPPASTLKTITTSTALKVLGENFTFKTDFLFKGHIEKNIATGIIYVKPMGDPTFGSTRFTQTKANIIFETIKKGLQQLGIKKLQGNIEIENSFFKDNAIHTGWLDEDIGNYYGAGIYPLNWRENKFTIGLTPSSNRFIVNKCDGNYALHEFKVEIEPKPNAGTEDVFGYIEKVNNYNYAIRGQLDPKKLQQEIELASIHPDEDFKKELIQFLEKEFQFININPTHFTTEKKICTITSPPLSQIVYWCNQKSLNLYAEALCKILATAYHLPPTWASGTMLIKKTIEAKKIDTKNITLLDGSGLAPNNKITTFMLATLLTSLKKERYYITFYKSLPIINDIHMKSGYIGGTRSYAGYITLPDGKEVSFSFIVSNYNGSPKSVKEKMFTFLNTLKK